MNRRRVLSVGLAALALSACGTSWRVSYEEVAEKSVVRNWRLDRISVTVPDNLTVSERNTFAPNADIVWRGEEFGDRRAQVRSILREGLQKGARGLNGNTPVIIAARLVHFHAVTPRAIDVAPSAVHNIAYDVQVYDSRSGKSLTQPKRISADLEANVGNAAVIAAIQGDTQRVRIVRHLAAVTKGWLQLGPDQRRSFEVIGR